MHLGAIGRKTLNQRRHAVIVEEAGHISLIGEHVAHCHPFVGHQHRQLADGLRARPICIEQLTMMANILRNGQRNGLHQVEGLADTDCMQNRFDTLERLVLATGRIPDYLEQHRRQRRILVHGARHELDTHLLARHQLAQFVE